MHTDTIPAILRRGYDYWNDKRAGRPMPARRDIEPAQIKPLLPHLILTDVLAGPDGQPYDFRYRLMGTTVEAHMGGKRTGRRLSELLSRRPDSELWRKLETVVQSKTPSFHHVPYIGPHSDFLAIADVVLPLSEDGVNVSMLMSVVDFVPRTASVG